MKLGYLTPLLVLGLAACVGEAGIGARGAIGPAAMPLAGPPGAPPPPEMPRPGQPPYARGPGYAKPGLSGVSPAELQQLQALALKRAPEVLPPPPGGVVGTMTLTERTGMAPAGCHRAAAGTKHDSLAGGTFQIWKRGC